MTSRKIYLVHSWLNVVLSFDTLKGCFKSSSIAISCKQNNTSYGKLNKGDTFQSYILSVYYVLSVIYKQVYSVKSSSEQSGLFLQLNVEFQLNCHCREIINWRQCCRHHYDLFALNTRSVDDNCFRITNFVLDV